MTYRLLVPCRYARLKNPQGERQYLYNNLDRGSAILDVLGSSVIAMIAGHNQESLHRLSTEVQSWQELVGA